VTRPQPADVAADLRRRHHQKCVVCSRENPYGLGLSFVPVGEHETVEAVCACDAAFAGYRDLVHGGVVCAILDGAMANCLFALGRVAHTAELTVRFHHPVHTGRDAIVRAWRVRSRGRLHQLRAEVHQDGQLRAAAAAKFLEAAAKRPLA
jgi:acyl-coenzyme A thioesterase PaaI-like protein